MAEIRSLGRINIDILSEEFGKIKTDEISANKKPAFQPVLFLFKIESLFAECIQKQIHIGRYGYGLSCRLNGVIYVLKTVS